MLRGGILVKVLPLTLPVFTHPGLFYWNGFICLQCIRDPERGGGQALSLFQSPASPVKDSHLPVCSIWEAWVYAGPQLKGSVTLIKSKLFWEKKMRECIWTNSLNNAFEKLECKHLAAFQDQRTMGLVQQRTDGLWEKSGKDWESHTRWTIQGPVSSACPPRKMNADQTCFSLKKSM